MNALTGFNPLERLRQRPVSESHPGRGPSARCSKRVKHCTKQECDKSNIVIGVGSPGLLRPGAGLDSADEGNPSLPLGNPSSAVSMLATELALSQDVCGIGAGNEPSWSEALTEQYQERYAIMSENLPEGDPRLPCFEALAWSDTIGAALHRAGEVVRGEGFLEYDPWGLPIRTGGSYPGRPPSDGSFTTSESFEAPPCVPTSEAMTTPMEQVPAELVPMTATMKKRRRSPRSPGPKNQLHLEGVR